MKHDRGGYIINWALWVSLCLVVAAALGTLFGFGAESAPVRADGYTVMRDDTNGALVYLYGNDGIAVVQFTPAAKASPTSAPSSTAPSVPSATPGATRTATVSATAVPATSTPAPSATPSQSPPTATATRPAPVVPVLVNPGFEEWAGGKPVGWEPYVAAATAGQPLEFNPERLSNGASEFIVFEGDVSARALGQWQCWIGGYRQTVAVMPFTTLQFTVHGLTWGNAGSDFRLASDPNLYSEIFAGIDPVGGTNAGTTGIRWASRPGWDGFQAISVDAVALTNRVTVFAQASLGIRAPGSCTWPLTHMLAAFDAAELTVTP